VAQAPTRPRSGLRITKSGPLLRVLGLLRTCSGSAAGRNKRLVRVWITDWELQCCGDPFSVGMPVSWDLVPADAAFREWIEPPLGAALAASISHYETHHHDGEETQPTLTPGRVEAIDAVFWRDAPRADEDPRVRYPVAGSAIRERRQHADGWETSSHDGLHFHGYIVELAPVGQRLADRD
jgi:uncharacterized protein DUF6578